MHLGPWRRSENWADSTWCWFWALALHSEQIKCEFEWEIAMHIMCQPAREWRMTRSFNSKFIFLTIRWCFRCRKVYRLIAKFSVIVVKAKSATMQQSFGLCHRYGRTYAMFVVEAKGFTSNCKSISLIPIDNVQFTSIRRNSQKKHEQKKKNIHHTRPVKAIVRKLLQGESIPSCLNMKKQK